MGAAAVPMTAAEHEVAERLIAEGCSYSEVARTIGRSHATVAKRFPGHAWSPKECGQFRAALRRANERMSAVAV